MKLYSHSEQELMKAQKDGVEVDLTFYQTKEGEKAYSQAITFLEKQKSLPPLKWNTMLYKASKDHVLDIGSKGLTSSMGSDGTMPSDRIARYGVLDSTWADSCIFGVLTPMEGIERLIVCDGQPQRNFRKAIFSNDLKSCGICCGNHLTHENIIQCLYVVRIINHGEKNECIAQQFGLKLGDKKVLTNITS